MKPIRLRFLDSFSKNICPRTAAIWTNRTILDAVGIEVVQSGEDAWYGNYQHDPQELDAASGRIVLEDMCDSTAIWKRMRAAIVHPNVVAVLRNSIFRDPALYCHAGKTDYCWGVQGLWELPASGLAKLRLVFSVVVHTDVELRRMTAGWMPWDARPYAYHCVVNTNYGESGRMVESHRRRWEGCVRSMDMPAVIFAGNRVGGRGIPGGEFLRTLASSKVCVSPLGWSAWSLRDNQALAAGCVLVKPSDAMEIRTIPDLRAEPYAPLVFFSDDRELLAVLERAASGDFSKRSQDVSRQFSLDAHVLANAIRLRRALEEVL